MKKTKIVLALLVIVLCVYFLRDLTSLIKRQKYDLDMCVVVDTSEISNSTDGISIKGGPYFADGTYKIYRFGKTSKVLVQYYNQDSSEADYFVPFNKDKMTYDKNEDVLTYNGRKFVHGEFAIYQDDSNCLNDCAIVQMIQPPPTIKVFHYLDFVQLAQGIMVLVAIVLYFAESRKELKIAQRNTYLNIETEANQVFRFEFENSGKLYWIYDEEDTGENLNAPERVWACQEYLCQILNLFEIAIELRTTGHLDDSVYDSWIRWFWDVSSAKNFGAFWKDLRSNYTAGLQAVIDDGVLTAGQIRKACAGKAAADVTEELSGVGFDGFNGRQKKLGMKEGRFCLFSS